MKDDSDIVSLARHIATFFYGDVTGVTRIASNNNYVFRLNLGNNLKSKVIKIGRTQSNEGLQREQQVMVALYNRGFDVPSIEFSQEDASFGIPFTIMPFIEGLSIYEVSTLEPSAIGTAYELLGAFMNRLSRIDAMSIPGVALIDDVRRDAEIAWTESHAELLKHRRCTSRLVEIYEHSRDLWGDPERFWCLTHGDSLQLLTDGKDTFSVIDWEAASVGHPLGESGYFLMSHGFWIYLQKQKGLSVYPEWHSRLLKGFLGATGMTTGQLAAMHILGTSSCIDEALAMSARNLSKTDDFFSFIEDEDAKFVASCRSENEGK